MSYNDYLRLRLFRCSCKCKSLACFAVLRRLFLWGSNRKLLCRPLGPRRGAWFSLASVLLQRPWRRPLLLKSPRNTFGLFGFLCFVEWIASLGCSLAAGFREPNL